MVQIYKKIYHNLQQTNPTSKDIWTLKKKKDQKILPFAGRSADEGNIFDHEGFIASAG